jgi:AcrR family transcriptional regulator
VGRREELLSQTVDYVWEHGLIGLTLRPLAAALGTSDRMLIYHFGSRDQLVSEVVAANNDFATAVIDSLPAARSVRAGVNALWRAYQVDPLHRSLDIYCQAVATGLLGEEPYRSVARASNARWSAHLADYFVRCGAPRRRVERIVRLVDSALFGFHVDIATDRPAELARGVDDLALAAERLAVD